MSLPLSRSEFAAFCKRQLGDGQINIEITDEQVDDAIDIALKWFIDYNAEATEKMYYKHQITQTDVDNKWIPMPDNIMGVIRIFPIGNALNSASMFNIRYQFALNDLYTLTNSSLVPYYMARGQIDLMEQMLVGQTMFRYSKHVDRCYIDTDWTDMTVGNYLCLECYQVIDPALFPEVWQDRWMMKYATALMKKQWGTNTKKYTGMKLPGGAEITGQQIYDEAIGEIMDMEKNAISYYSYAVMDQVG